MIFLNHSNADIHLCHLVPSLPNSIFTELVLPNNIAKHVAIRNIVDLIEVNDELSSVGSKIVAVKLRDPWTNGQKMSYSGPDY